MKIPVYGIHCAPELTGIGRHTVDVAASLAARSRKRARQSAATQRARPVRGCAAPRSIDSHQDLRKERP
jgi:hypothetical protein